MIGPGVIIAERFRLERPLGKGGMGTVWLAHHQALDIPCAVKLIRAGADEMFDLRARFAREAKAAAALRSPHVVTILDHGEWEGTPYIAMELLEGEDLARRLKRQKRLSSDEIVSIVSQIARALSKAHAVGLVHRDMKPANIFLAKDDDREITKVLDFGIAKANTLSVGDASTKTGSLLGTPFYMSPELAQGTKQIDHLADLWSLGVVVFQALVGRLPFESTALGDLLMKIMTLPLPVPSECVDDLPKGFDGWWERAASRDPRARFQTARELAEALALALDAKAASSVSLGRAVGSSASLVPPVPASRSGSPESNASSPPTPMPSSSPSLPPATPMPQSDGSARVASMALSGAVPIPISILPAPPPRPGRRWIAAAGVANVAGGAALVVALSGGRAVAPTSNGGPSLDATAAPPPSVAPAKPAPSPSPTVAPAAPPTVAASAAPSAAEAAASATTRPSSTPAGRAPRHPPPSSRAPKPPSTENQTPQGTDYGI